MSQRFSISTSFLDKRLSADAHVRTQARKQALEPAPEIPLESVEACALNRVTNVFDKRVISR